MSKSWPGGIIKKTSPTVDGSQAKGIWSISQANEYKKQNLWPTVPGAPTIGSPTDGTTVGQAKIAFTPPSDTGSVAITGYTATSTPGCITGTGSSSPVTVNGLTTGQAYTFKVSAVNGAGSSPESGASCSFTPSAFVDSLYSAPGTYSWIAPTGVTSVSVVAVGAGGSGAGYRSYRAPGSETCCVAGGGGGGGGALGYKNNYAVTPGNAYTVVVGAAGVPPNHANEVCGVAGGDSYFVSVCVVKGGGGQGAATPGSSATRIGGTYTGDGGGNGGNGPQNTSAYASGGGGAGGYAGNGGNGGAATQNGFNGSGGGGGGGSGAGSLSTSGAGGGVGLYGQGSNGTGGTYGTDGQPGTGGSGGANGSASPGDKTRPSTGGIFGGGGGSSDGVSYEAGSGGSGGVRIVWPGNTRSFPSTCVGSP